MLLYCLYLSIVESGNDPAQSFISNLWIGINRTLTFIFGTKHRRLIKLADVADVVKCYQRFYWSRNGLFIHFGCCTNVLVLHDLARIGGYCNREYPFLRTENKHLMMHTQHNFIVKAIDICATPTHTNYCLHLSLLR